MQIREKTINVGKQESCSMDELHPSREIGLVQFHKNVWLQDLLAEVKSMPKMGNFNLDIVYK